ncbi:uncharacterized protein Smp_201690 [Schistosoma mansoni]|uniref:Smp_201690 n=1 Tax=Schistosoma mansoni TaxID=6183 RepID=G4VE72_SCHMA|nr:uncharacterized protein Smp_201690 [Schistosoma mansoni]|eukprot:XP_018649736.1 uncharacterized protein Smp_201690 [Schistosoma mansoni]
MEHIDTHTHKHTKQRYLPLFSVYHRITNYIFIYLMYLSKTLICLPLFFFL